MDRGTLGREIVGSGRWHLGASEVKNLKENY